MFSVTMVMEQTRFWVILSLLKRNRKQTNRMFTNNCNLLLYNKHTYTHTYTHTHLYGYTVSVCVAVVTPDHLVYLTWWAWLQRAEEGLC